MYYASIAQQAARESHNLEVVSSILTRSTKVFILSMFLNTRQL